MLSPFLFKCPCVRRNRCCIWCWRRWLFAQKLKTLRTQKRWVRGCFLLMLSGLLFAQWSPFKLHPDNRSKKKKKEKEKKQTWRERKRKRQKHKEQRQEQKPRNNRNKSADFTCIYQLIFCPSNISTWSFCQMACHSYCPKATNKETNTLWTKCYFCVTFHISLFMSLVFPLPPSHCRQFSSIQCKSVRHTSASTNSLRERERERRCKWKEV